MRTSVKLTQWSMGMREGVIGTVLVGVGDWVESGAPLVEVEAEKATDQLTAPVAGRVAAVFVHPGDTVPIGCELLVIEAAT